MIEIVAPHADWPIAFKRLVAGLRPVLPQGARLHHIGSTAVPGLPAKDVIDIQLSVCALSDVDAAALEAMGFVEREGLCDHSPSGLELPSPDLSKRFFKESVQPANLHVRVFGRYNQRYALLCRDYLRARPRAAAAYAEVKVRLAATLAYDHARYSDTKDPVFDLIMVAAEDWAAAIGWREPEED